MPPKGATVHSLVKVSHAIIKDGYGIWPLTGNVNSETSANLQLTHSYVSNMPAQNWIFDETFRKPDDPQGIFLIEGNVFENVGRFTVRSRYPFTAIFRNNRFVSKGAGSNYWIQSLRCYGYAGNPCTPILVENNSFLDDGVALSLTEATLGENDPAIDARNNFWDTTDESLISSRIADKNVDISLSGEIPFKPYRTEPHPDTP